MGRAEHLHVNMVVDHDGDVAVKKLLELFDCFSIIKDDIIHVDYNFVVEYMGQISARFEAILKLSKMSNVKIKISEDSLNDINCLFLRLVHCIDGIRSNNE